MSRTANRRANKKARQFRNKHGCHNDNVMQALGCKFSIWRREARARVDTLRNRGQPSPGVWQLQSSWARFIKALRLPTPVETEALEELNEILRSSFSGFMPFCRSQLNLGRRIGIRNKKESANTMQGKRDHHNPSSHPTTPGGFREGKPHKAYDRSALAQVIEYGNEQDLNCLLEVGCDVNTPLGQDGWPPLCCAVARQDGRIVDRLLSHGADPNQAVARGMGAGMVALDFCRDVSIARKLLHAGARLDVRDNHGWTPRHWASHMRCDPILDLFDQGRSSP